MYSRDYKDIYEAYKGKPINEAAAYFNQMDSEYECKHCDVHFNDEDEYKHHLKTIHDFQDEHESGERKDDSKPTTKEDHNDKVVGEATSFDEDGTKAEVIANGDQITIKFSKNSISGNAKDIEAFINKVHAEVLTHVDKDIYG
jgi:hypothetical protein